MSNQNDYKNKYMNNPNKDALTAAFRPREAAAIRRYVSNLLNLKALNVEEMNPFEIRKSPPKLPVDDLDVMIGRKLEGNLVKEGTFELLQSIVSDWYEENNEHPLEENDFESIMGHIAEETYRCNIKVEDELELEAKILIHLLECLELKKKNVNDLIKSAWKIHRKNVELRQRRLNDSN